MKNILVPVEDHDSIHAVMETALLLGSQFDSCIEGIGLGPDAGDLIAADFAIAGTIFDEKSRREMRDNTRRLFEDFMVAHQVPPVTSGTAGLRYSWVGGELSTDSAIGGYARIADLIVVGRPGSKRGDPRAATLESVLFEAGRPILITPHAAPATLGETIVISWNRSTETARAVGFAMPLLRRAKRIIILTVSGALAPGPSAEALARALQRHSLPVDVVTVDSGTRSGGKVILEQAALLGGDLLVKGGYTQSRLRQMIFGGPTSEILASAELPVFMAH